MQSRGSFRRLYQLSRCGERQIVKEISRGVIVCLELPLRSSGVTCLFLFYCTNPSHLHYSVQSLVAYGPNERANQHEREHGLLRPQPYPCGMIDRRARRARRGAACTGTLNLFLIHADTFHCTLNVGSLTALHTALHAVKSVGWEIESPGRILAAIPPRLVSRKSDGVS